MTTYRAAIIGLSGIAAAVPDPASDPVLGTALPNSHAAAYAAVPSTRVVAVCDLQPTLIERFQANWGAVFPEVRGYTDYRQLLRDERVDLLSVVTPDDRHAQIAVDAVAAGVRGFFCEKPIATTLADADRIIDACAAAGVPLLVNHTRRWYPDYLAARRLVRAGAIGPLRRIVATLGGPRAMLFRNGTHLMDAICLFAEREPTWVIGRLDDEHADYGPRYAGDGGRDPATDPGGSALIGFDGGLRALVNASKETPSAFEFDLIGATGRLRIGRDSAELTQATTGEYSTSRHLPPPPVTRAGMAAAVQELVDLVERGGTPSSSGADARRVLALLLAILQSSAAGGQRVDFPIVDA